MRLLLLFSLLVHLFLLSSCKKYQPADSSFFVKPGAISVSPNSKEGTGSHKITDLWLYVNGKFKGAYPYTSIMPVVSDGNAVRINVYAGIKNNGISDTRIFYPFFDFLTIDTLVPSGQLIERPFTFKYRESTVVEWREDFDNIGSSLKSISADATMDFASPEESFEKKSLRVTMPAGGILARIESSSSGFELPSSTSNVYLELDYKCNTGFTIGLIGADGTQSAAILINPQDNWNHIYVQLSTAVNTLLSTKYKVYFEFTKNPNDTEPSQIFLDNLKLLYL